MSQTASNPLDLANAVCRVKAAHDRHLAIHQDEVERFLSATLNRRQTVWNGHDRAAQVPQNAGGDLLVHRVVLNDKDVAIEGETRPLVAGADVERGDPILSCTGGY